MSSQYTYSVLEGITSNTSIPHSHILIISRREFSILNFICDTQSILLSSCTLTEIGFQLLLHKFEFIQFCYIQFGIVWNASSTILDCDMCVEMLSRLFLIATIIVTFIVVTNIVVTFIIVTIDEKCVFGARSLVSVLYTT